MCAIYGFLDYSKKMPHRVLRKLLRELSIAAEIRGTDATGISYVKDGKLVTFKKAKPAHRVKLYFPKGTTAIIGHTRMTTQGDEHYNYNNHPFEGKTETHAFALTHNGMLYNDKELRRKYQLPDTPIETDSYVAVQLLEHSDSVGVASIKNMAEAVKGSFVFTILRSDNTLFLVKGRNPITLLHFPEYGLYLYASTEEILRTALKSSNVSAKYENVPVLTGDIICINSEGNLSVSTYDEDELEYHCHGINDWYDGLPEYEADLLMLCGWYGVSREEVQLLLNVGFSCDEIEEMLLDEDLLHEALEEAEAMYQKN